MATPAGRALSSLTVARPLPGRRRRRPAARSASLLGERPLVQLAIFVARPAAARLGRRRPRALPAERPAHGHPGPGAPRRDRRRPARDHQRRHPPRRPVGADRAAARPSSGRSPRFVVERLAGGDDRRRCTTACTATAGAGTPSARCGCGWSTRSGSSSAAPSAPTPPPLLVVPRVRPLGAGGPAGGHGGGGEGARRTIAVHGEDDVSTREYRHGDDLRKVHWRATARTGELMVRLEERPWRSQATLLLDTRSRAHLVAGRGRPDSPVARARAGDDCPPAGQPRVAGRGGGEHRHGAGPPRLGAAHGHRHRRARAAVGPRPAERRTTCWTGWPPSAPPASPRPERTGSSSCAGPPATGRSSACSARSARTTSPT